MILARVGAQDGATWKLVERRESADNLSRLGVLMILFPLIPSSPHDMSSDITRMMLGFSTVDSALRAEHTVSTPLAER